MNFVHTPTLHFPLSACFSDKAHCCELIHSKIALHKMHRSEYLIIEQDGSLAAWRRKRGPGWLPVECYSALLVLKNILCYNAYTLCFLMVPCTTLLILCAILSYSAVTLCYSATAHSAYAPLQLESARLYTTVGARVGLAPSRLPASNTTAGDQRVEGPTTGPSLPIEGRRQITSKRQE